jgi:hypothetical protein
VTTGVGMRGRSVRTLVAPMIALLASGDSVGPAPAPVRLSPGAGPAAR